MNKHIIAVAKEKIESLNHQYAENFISRARVDGKTDPANKKIADTNDFNMKNALEQIEWLENFIKEQSPKKK